MKATSIKRVPKWRPKRHKDHHVAPMRNTKRSKECQNEGNIDQTGTKMETKTAQGPPCGPHAEKSRKHEPKGPLNRVGLASLFRQKCITNTLETSFGNPSCKSIEKDTKRLPK